MLTLTEAQAALRSLIVPTARAEPVPLAHACGRYVAAELKARVDNPAFDNAAMDGYAFLASGEAGSSLDAGHTLPVAGEASCGSRPATLAPGTAMRIFTGAPLPAGADTVVMQEDVHRAGGSVTLTGECRAGDHVRHRGEDFRAGETLYATGRRLGAFDIALLSAAGLDEVPVFARPRVLVAATGDELVAAGRPLAPGQIYESNRLTTQRMLEELGAEVEDGGTIRDDVAALRGFLDRAREFDFVVTSGGASVGDHDHIKSLFAEVGSIQFWRVKIKPGKPIAFGRVGARGHFFALPGNPVSSLVTFKLFVEPALAWWHHGHHAPLRMVAPAGGDFRRKPGRREFLRAALVGEAGGLTAVPLRGQGSHMLAPLKDTNAFIVLPEESDGFRDGEPVEVWPLRF